MHLRLDPITQKSFACCIRHGRATLFDAESISSAGSAASGLSNWKRPTIESWCSGSCLRAAVARSVLARSVLARSVLARSERPWQQVAVPMLVPLPFFARLHALKRSICPTRRKQDRHRNTNNSIYSQKLDRFRSTSTSGPAATIPVACVRKLE